MKIRGSGFFGIPSFDVISVITGVTHGGIMPHGVRELKNKGKGLKQ